MKSADFEKLVSGLGRTQSDLVASSLLPDVILEEAYPGSDRLFFEPEEGLEVVFNADEKRFYQFFITLKKTTPSTVCYTGELPDIFFVGMRQDDVHDLFGVPDKVRSPVKMPFPRGQTGGWEAYIYDAELFPGVMLEFQYTEEMEVDTIVFFVA